MHLLMPAWTSRSAVRSYLGVKVVNVFPGNSARGLPAVNGTYLLMSGETGQPLAVLDGSALTTRRTAAASALAAHFLAREDAETLLMIGAGALAPHFIAAHCCIRPIRRVLIWNRTPSAAEVLATRLSTNLGRSNIAISAISDLETGVRQADIISSATISREPLIHGEWLRSGSHIDLVGGFTSQMREADDEVVRRAAIYVDTREGALKEAGDITDPIQRGIITAADVQGELAELCGGQRAGRTTPEQITLFKSVGTALEDLAAAVLAYELKGGL